MPAGLTLAFSTRAKSPRLGRYIRQLKHSCGVERLEILYQVNPGSKSLSSLYNQFLEQASFDVVCLVHDDLVFARQSAWGRQILQAFARYPEYAVFSAAGSVALESQGIYWDPPSNMLGQVIHRLQGKDQLSAYSAAQQQPLEALVLDGLLLAVHRQRLSTAFDERLGGFHFYDLAFSLGQSLAAQRGEGERCGVLSRLKPTHLSIGRPSEAYEQAREQFLRLYQAVLPCRLRPELNLVALAGQIRQAAAPELEILIWHHQAQVSPHALLQRLQSSSYAPVCLKLFSQLPLTFAPLPFAENPQFEIVQTAAQSWAELNPLLLEHLSQSQAEYVLLLDSQVLPLQDWLPQLLLNFRRQPELGTLGLRLHYPDTHLLYHNGLKLIKLPNGLLDVSFRGIHSPYSYQNALEWNPEGSASHALMLRSRLFIELGGLAGQSWIPGLELNLKARQAGWRNAVDSRLVGYWLAPEADEGLAQHEYAQFLDDFQGWLRQAAYAV